MIVKSAGSNNLTQLTVSLYKIALGDSLGVGFVTKRTKYSETHMLVKYAVQCLDAVYDVAIKLR